MNKQISLLMLLKVLFILLPLFLITILMSSCEKDFDESPDSHSGNHIQVKEYSFKEIIKQPKFSTAFSKVENGIKNKSNKSSDVEENQLNFSIDPATVKEIILNNKTTYTMLVVRGQSSPDFFENYVVEIDATNKISAFLIKYIPDREIKKHEAHNSFSFHGTTEITNINYDSSIFHARERDGECNMSIVCNYGGSEHAAGSNCTQCYSVINCISSSGGSYTGSTAGNTITTGSGATGGTQGGNLGGNAGSNNSNTTTTTPTTSNPVVTSPVITEAYLSQQAKLKRSKNFYTSLTVDQRTWLNNNLDIKSQIEAYLEKTIGYLDLINYYPEDVIYVKELINISAENNATFIFKNDLNANNSLTFNSLSEMRNYFKSLLENQTSTISLITQGDTKVGKVKTNIGMFTFLNVEVNQTLNPYKVNGVSSSISGNTLCLSYDQKTPTDLAQIMTNGNVVTITFSSSLNINALNDNIGTLWTFNVTIIVKTNKLTGEIISIDVNGLP
jgi:hypothetical protein